MLEKTTYKCEKVNTVYLKDVRIMLQSDFDGNYDKIWHEFLAI